jgi:hypothetical protein
MPKNVVGARDDRWTESTRESNNYCEEALNTGEAVCMNHDCEILKKTCSRDSTKFISPFA